MCSTVTTLKQSGQSTTAICYSGDSGELHKITTNNEFSILPRNLKLMLV